MHGVIVGVLVCVGVLAIALMAYGAAAVRRSAQTAPSAEMLRKPVAEVASLARKEAKAAVASARVKARVKAAARPRTKTTAGSKAGTGAHAKTTAKRTASNSGGQKLAGLVICIDAGHQEHADSGLEPIGPGSSTKKQKVMGGATGVSTGTPEYKLNLAVALKLKALLRAQGAKVFMTRETNDVNISASARAKLANRAGADLAIRIHADGVDNRSTHGVSVLYPAASQWTGSIRAKSKRAAQQVLDGFVSATGANDRGIVARGDITGFNWSKVPVILVEMGFLSNPGEDRRLNTDGYRDKMARGMRNGILRYFGK